MRNILGTDAQGNFTNPVVQQAANSVMQQFAGRGLLNSSMASEAAYQAAMSKAIEIAGPDAQTYFAQGRANQDAANVFERDARGYAQDNFKLDKTIGFEREKLDKTIGAEDRRLDKTIGAEDRRLDKTIGAEDRRLDKTIGFDREKLDKTIGADDRRLDKTIGFDREKLEKTIGFESDKLNKTIDAEDRRLDKNISLDREKLDKSLTLEREKLTQSGSQFNRELAYKYDAMKLEAQTRVEAEARAHKYALEIKNIESVNSSYDLYLRRISDIDANKDYDAATKVQLKNAAGKDFDIYAKAKGIAWEVSLGDRFSQKDTNQPPPKAPGLLDS